MGIPDRIILTLYTCLMAVFAVTLIMITMGMIPPDFFRRVIVALPGNWEFAQCEAFTGGHRCAGRK